MQLKIFKSMCRGRLAGISTFWREEGGCSSGERNTFRGNDLVNEAAEIWDLDLSKLILAIPGWEQLTGSWQIALVADVLTQAKVNTVEVILPSTHVQIGKGLTNDKIWETVKVSGFTFLEWMDDLRDKIANDKTNQQDRVSGSGTNIGFLIDYPYETTMANKKALNHLMNDVNELDILGKCTLLEILDAIENRKAFFDRCSNREQRQCLGNGESVWIHVFRVHARFEK